LAVIGSPSFLFPPKPDLTRSSRTFLIDPAFDVRESQRRRRIEPKSAERFARIVSNLQPAEGLIKHASGKSLAGFPLNLLVQYVLGLGQMIIDPIREFYVCTNPCLHQIRMLAQEFSAHDEMCGYELTLGP